MMFALWCLSLALKRNYACVQRRYKSGRGAIPHAAFVGCFFSAMPTIIISSCAGEQQMAEHRLYSGSKTSGRCVAAVMRYRSMCKNSGVRLANFSVYGRNIPWRFSVVRNLAPNAFSIGGGYVFITDGAVNFVQNESEMAAILAHEIGHELAGHFCGASDPSNSGGLFDIFSTPETQQHKVGVGSMTLSIDPVKEQQADQIALSILQAGGYDPQAMLDVARRMPSGESCASHGCEPHPVFGADYC